jgi:hypothetical protein
MLANGTEVLLTPKAGDVFKGEPVTHKMGNTGRTPIHNLMVA